MPKSPFSNRPLEQWVNELQSAASPDDRYRALLAVVSMGSPQQQMTSCVLSLSDADSGVRALAAKQLRDLKVRDKPEPGASDDAWKAIEAKLVTLLRDDDPDVRFESARALTQVAPEQSTAAEVLLTLLDDEETQPLMLAVVVTAVGERVDLTPEVLLTRFQKLLGHSQAEIRENSSGVVSRWGAGAAPLIEQLVIALDDEEPIVRENAAIAIGGCGVNSDEVLQALKVAATDEDEGVAAAANSALKQLQQ